MIGALDVRGVRAMVTVEGGTDADVFETFLERVLVRKLRPRRHRRARQRWRPQAREDAPPHRGSRCPGARRGRSCLAAELSLTIRHVTSELHVTLDFPRL